MLGRGVSVRWWLRAASFLGVVESVNYVLAPRVIFTRTRWGSVVTLSTTRD